MTLDEVLAKLSPERRAEIERQADDLKSKLDHLFDEDEVFRRGREAIDRMLRK